MTRYWGVDDKAIQERLEVLHQEIDEKFERQLDQIHRHAINKYPARIVDITTELTENWNRFRKAEREELIHERTWKSEALQKAKEYFREKGE